MVLLGFKLGWLKLELTFTNIANAPLRTHIKQSDFDVIVGYKIEFKGLKCACMEIANA